MLFSGNLLSVLHTLSAIGHLTIARLKVILKTHRLPFLRCKDDFIMHVFLLRQGHPGEKRVIRPKGLFKGSNLS